MMTHLAFCASLILVLAVGLSTQPFSVATDAAAQARSAQGAQPREQAPSNMQDMKKMHDEMMAEMKAADSRLDSLVKNVNAATGDAKVTAIAAVVTELVRQQKSMHDRMGQMHQQMMMGGMMMKK